MNKLPNTIFNSHYFNADIPPYWKNKQRDS